MDEHELKKALAWILDLDKFIDILYTDSFENKDFSTCVEEKSILSMNRIVNQFGYWNRKLTSDLNERSVMFALIDCNGYKNISPIEICAEIKKIIPLSCIESVNFAENNHFFGLDFHKIEDKINVMKNFKALNGAYVAYIGKYKNVYFDYKIHWLPSMFPLDVVLNLIRPFTEFLSNEYEMTKVDEEDNLYIKSNIIKGKLKLKKEFSLNSLPHLLKIAPSKSVLLIIKQRPPLCLKCFGEGHIRKNCNSTRCMVCYKNHDPVFKCQVDTFASKVKNYNSKLEIDTLDLNLENKMNASLNSVESERNEVSNWNTFSGLQEKCDKIIEETISSESNLFVDRVELIKDQDKKDENENMDFSGSFSGKRKAEVYSIDVSKIPLQNKFDILSTEEDPDYNKIFPSSKISKSNKNYSKVKKKDFSKELS